MEMFYVLCDVVLSNNVDVGLVFDGDGDCCGVVDNIGEEIFVDKVGVMFVRDLLVCYDNV